MQFCGILKMNMLNYYIFLSCKYGNVNYGIYFDFNVKYFQFICRLKININGLIWNFNYLSENKVVNLRINVVFNYVMFVEEKCYLKCYKFVYLVFLIYLVFVYICNCCCFFQGI